MNRLKPIHEDVTHYEKPAALHLALPLIASVLMICHLAALPLKLSARNNGSLRLMSLLAI